MIGIYEIINLINNKIYIGSSINIDKRIYRHFNDLKNNKHINIYLQREYNIYGLTAFTYKCIDECCESDLRIIEQKYLDDIFKIKNFNKYYYNICDKSCGGDNLTNNPNKNNIIKKIINGLYNRYKNETEEDKTARIKKITGKNNPNYGKKWSIEQKLRMSKQRKGLKSNRKGKTYKEIYGDRENEIKNKIKNNKSIQKGENSPNYGKKCPDYLKKYYSEKFKGKRNKNILNNFKPFKIDEKIYILLTDAEKDLNINYLTIRYRLLSDNLNFNNYKYITDKNEIELIKADYILKLKNDNENDKNENNKIIKQKRTGKPIIIDNIKYDSSEEASKKLNIPKSTINWRLNSTNFNNYKYK
jgi:group I intron endonuclease